MALHSARIDSIVTAALGNRNPIGHAQGLPPPKKITKKKRPTPTVDNKN